MTGRFFGRIVSLVSKKTRTEILAAVLAAFAGMPGNLSETEWERGIAIVEGEFDCDLDAVAAALRAELAACALACRVAEKG